MKSAMIVERHGIFTIRSAQLRQPCGSLSSGWVLPMWKRRLLMWGPSAPNIAGSSVAAAATATTTATAAV